MNFKDVFISYGRKESKAFASKLHNRLIKEGLEVWFDQNDIPLGMDFQDQIDEGIEKAHNLVFVIAPHSVQSKFCLKEIELAVKRRKRIIPILHIEDADSLERLHPVISKRNWIYAREKLEEGRGLEELESIDDFEVAFDGLMSLVHTHEGYVKSHTSLLSRALEWEQKQRSTEYLLVGRERREAEVWLGRDFPPPDQPPCDPSELHCDYISESKKNGENLMTDVFLSFASSDGGMKDRVVNSLARFAITSWVHNNDIEKGTDFSDSIYKGIEQADSVLYLVSAESIQSEWCLKELEYGVSLHKKIIPLLIEPISADRFPKEIAGLQYIDFTDNVDKTDLSRYEKSDFEKDIDSIIGEVRKDQTYYHYHKVFLVRAKKWERQHKNPSMLLRGYDLDNAKTWMDSGQKRDTNHPIAVHEAYIEQSISMIGRLGTEVFVSYSRKDGDFARKLNSELQSHEKTTWFDQESIAEGADFQTEIYHGIEQAENFLFVISPDSINSPHCADEVAYAQRMGKRIITIHHRQTDPSTMPSALAAVQWINFAELGYEKGLIQLIRNLNIDREHVQSHTLWSQKALEWEGGGKPNSLLLRGSELSVARSWLDLSIKEEKQPKPTSLQSEYIEHSRRGALVARYRLMAGFVLFIILLAGLFFMYAQYQRAELSKREADVQRREAELQKAEADKQRERAEDALVNAEALRKKAVQAAKEAKRLEIVAQEARMNAEVNEEEAIKAQQRAQEAKKIADQRRREAEEASRMAEKEKLKANTAATVAKEANERSKLQLYLFNASRFANKSIREQDDTLLKAQLAVTAYQMIEKAYQIQPDKRAFNPDILLAMQEALKPYTKPIEITGEFKSIAIQGVDVFTSYAQGKVREAEISDALPYLKKGGDIELPENVVVEFMETTPDGLLITTANGGLYHWQSPSKSTRLLKDFTNRQVLDMLYDQTGNRAVISLGGNIPEIVVWDLSANRPERKLIQIPRVMCLSLDTEKDILYGGNDSGEIKRFDLKATQPKGEVIHKYGAKIRAMDFSQKHGLLAWGDQLGQVFLASPDSIDSAELFPSSHHGNVHNVSFSKDGKWLATVGLDGSLMLWDLLLTEEAKVSISSLEALEIKSNEKIFSMGFDEGSQYLVYGGENLLNIRLVDESILYDDLMKVSNGQKMSRKNWEYYRNGDIEQP